VVLCYRSFLQFFGRKLLFTSNQRREALSSAMASGQASQDLSDIHIHFPNPAVAREELGLTYVRDSVSTVNLRVSLPQAISRSAQAETRAAPS